MNAAFALLVGDAAAAGGFQSRMLHFDLLFALCSSIVIDIDRLNGRTPCWLFMLSTSLVRRRAIRTISCAAPILLRWPRRGRRRVLSKAEAVILAGGIMLVLGYRLAVFSWMPGRPSAIPRLAQGHDSHRRSHLVGHRHLVRPISGTSTSSRTPPTRHSAKAIASISTFAASANILGR